MRLLDLFCGAGGAAMGYYHAGFEIVGVDIKPQPNYPFEFVQGDALAYVAEHGNEFDAVHASPPCQAYTAYRNCNRYMGKYPELIEQTRQVLQTQGVEYVIENVRGAPLHAALMLCGSSFGLDIRRHRYFEVSSLIFGLHCDHSWQTPRFPSPTNNEGLRSTVEVGAWRCVKLSPNAMGIDWMTNEGISQAIPPVYTEYIG